MSAVLNVSQQNLGAEDVVNLLTSPQVLPHLLRELTIERAIAEIDYSDAELTQCCEALAKKPQYFNVAPEQIRRIAPRQLKLQKFKLAAWGNLVEADFLNQQERYDQVLFSLIQTDNLEIIQELYFRLREGEADFAELATRYSQGPEARTNGLVGPLELHNLHQKLAQMLRISQPGQVSPPFRVDQWVVIVRLERYIPAQFDQALRQRLLDERFETWMRQAIAQQADVIQIPDLLNLPAGAAPASLPAVAPATEPAPAPVEPQAIAPLPSSIDEELEPPLYPENSPAAAKAPQNAAPKSLPVPTVNGLDRDPGKRRSPRFTEAVLMSLVPLALGGWSLAALFGFGSDSAPDTTAQLAETANSPTSSTAIVATTQANAQKEAFRNAVNHANAAVEAIPKARTAADWDAIAHHWETSVELMRAVPVDDPNYAQAQDKVIEYQGYEEYARQQQGNSDLAFYTAVRDAEEAVLIGQSAQTHQNWDKAVRAWDQAVVSMEAVPEDSQFYGVAQEKAIEYQVYLEYVKRLRDNTETIAFEVQIQGRDTQERVALPLSPSNSSELSDGDRLPADREVDGDDPQIDASLEGADADSAAVD
jgi:hypothetical protein